MSLLSDMRPTGLASISDGEEQDDDDDDVMCFYLSSAECCTGMLPVFDKKQKETSELFFYVLYRTIPFFSNKMIARVQSRICSV